MIIGELSRRTGIPCSTLRYYEDKGLIRVGRDAGQRRDYREADIEWVKFLQKLKHTGMSLKNMEEYARLRYEGDATMGQRLELLKVHEAYVREQRKQWEEYEKNLQDKIGWYTDKIDAGKVR